MAVGPDCIKVNRPVFLWRGIVFLISPLSEITGHTFSSPPGDNAAGILVYAARGHICSL
jgi:hypothetical protein